LSLDLTPLLVLRIEFLEQVHEQMQGAHRKCPNRTQDRVS
jgi:hypothetical protein